MKSPSPPSPLSFLNSLHESSLAHVARKDLSTCSVFWISLVALQRIVGCFRIHAGLPLPMTALCGLGIITTGNYLTSTCVPKVHQFLEGKCTFTDIITTPASFHLTISKADLIRSSVCNTLCFAALERSFFRTLLPSSIISVGAYARKSASLPATGDIATSTQRMAMQRFGVLNGCHQCGSRQLLRQMYRETINKTPKFVQNVAGTKGFIADHMPPTLFMDTILKSKWARLTNGLGYPTRQRLYPQCIKCFSIQGQHVKSMTHKMIFHSQPRLVHLSPIIAFYLTNTKMGKKFISGFVDPFITNPLEAILEESEFWLP